RWRGPYRLQTWLAPSAILVDGAAPPMRHAHRTALERRTGRAIPMCADRMAPPVRPTPDRPPPFRRSVSPGGPQRFAGTGRETYSTVVLIDVAGSAARDGRGQRRMRDDVNDLVSEVAEDNGVDLESLNPYDTGDGLRLIVPLDVMRPARAVDAFVAGLTA